MIRHIVLFKLNSGLTRDDPQVAATFQALTELGPTLPIVRAWEVRECFGTRPVSHEFALISEFDDEADLAAYGVDPDHRKVMAQLDQIITPAVADFLI